MAMAVAEPGGFALKPFVANLVRQLQIFQKNFYENFEVVLPVLGGGRLLLPATASRLEWRRTTVGSRNHEGVTESAADFSDEPTLTRLGVLPRAGGKRQDHRDR